MQNLQTATLAKTADGLFLVQLPRTMHVNPVTLPRRVAAPLGDGGVGMMVRRALNAFDDATQVSHSLVGLDRF